MCCTATSTNEPSGAFLLRPLSLRSAVKLSLVSRGLLTPTVTLLTSHSGEPFYLHVMPVGQRRPPTYAVSVRSSGADVHAFRQRYRLSAREGQITELVLRGLGNREIAQSLSISLATAKKHLGKIFDKVGVDSRGQLMARLG